MSSSSFSNDENKTLLLTFDQLLDSIGYSQWISVIATVIPPSIGLIGIILCIISAYIFFQSKFKEPVFFYYRLICLIYILILIHAIPNGFLFSFRYFSNIDSYLFSIYSIYNSILNLTFFNFEDTLKMGILLDRMKLFSPFVRKYFSAKPQIVSLAFFLTAFAINFPLTFGLKIDRLYFSPNSNQTKNGTLYYTTSSDFSLTPFGQIFFAFTSFFLNFFITLVVDIILNIVSVYQFKVYLRQRRQRDRENYIRSHNVSGEMTRRELTPKEKNDRRAEKNMFYMALTLCSISIFSRSLFMFSYVYYFFFNGNYVILALISYAIYTLVPSVAIFAFYSFNKVFREEFNVKILRNKISFNMVSQVWIGPTTPVERVKPHF
jgi:hypothetical protein